MQVASLRVFFIIKSYLVRGADLGLCLSALFCFVRGWHWVGVSSRVS